MAALTAASQARIASSHSTVPASTLSAGGITGPYPGGITSANHLTGALDPLSNNSSSVGGLSNFQMPHNHSLPPPPNSITNAPFLDPSMSQSYPAAQNLAQNVTPLKQRQQGFLVGLNNIMAKRNTPLPPALTGIASPSYDPNNTVWKNIEPSPTEIGAFRLAGKDVNLFKLWGVVFQAGGGTTVRGFISIMRLTNAFIIQLNNSNGWNTILPQFDLPDQFPQANGSTSVAMMLSQYYMAILHPFEEMYKRNLHGQQRKAQLASAQLGAQGQQLSSTASGQGRPPQGGSNGSQPAFPGQMQRGATANTMGLVSQPIAGAHASGSTVNGTSQFHQPSQTPQVPHQQLPSSTFNMQQPNQGISQSLNAAPQSESIAAAHQSNVPASEQNVLDQDVQGIKRKLDSEEADGKRARQKTGKNLLLIR